jgi:Ca-activated chloride channel family protein
MMAHKRGVPVFGISAGRQGIVPMPYIDADGRKSYRQMQSNIDEEELWMMAMGTGGKFFRVAATDTIASAFKAIDRAQKIEFQAKSHLIATELFWWLAAPGLLALAGAAAFARPVWKREAYA